MIRGQDKRKLEKREIEGRYRDFIRARENIEGDKTAEELYLELLNRKEYTEKDDVQELKDVDIAIALDYAEKIKKHLNRANDTIQPTKVVESEEAIKDKIFRRYGLEGDVLDKLEKIKDEADEGYTEMSYSLIVLNMILRNFATEESILQAEKYLNSINKSSKHYIIDKETMSNLLDLEEDIEIESVIIDADQDIKKSISRIRMQEKLREFRVETEQYLKQNGSFLVDVISNNAVKWDDYHLDEERNYCYLDGKYYLNQWNELIELEYSEL